MKISERIPHTEHTLRLQAGKKVYFVSDVHLGAPVLDNDRERENRLIRWLDTIRPDCGELFLLGDIFDFWFEYKRAVPKGHVRFLAKICEFTDQGIPVHFFTGNHDIWAFGYLPEECGVILHTHNEIFRIAGKRFLIGHGDALNPQDKGYLFLYRIFHNRFLQRCFRWLHPDIGILIARKWSSHSRLENGKSRCIPGSGKRRDRPFLPGSAARTTFRLFHFRTPASAYRLYSLAKQPLYQHRGLDHLL